MLLVLATVAEGALPVAVNAEDDVEVEGSGVWVVSDADDVGTDVVISETAVVETGLEVEVVDGEVVDVVVEVDVVLDEVEEVVDEVVDVVVGGIVVAAEVVVVLIGAVVVVVVVVVVEAVVEAVVKAVVEAVVEADVVVVEAVVEEEAESDSTEPQPPAGAGITSSECPECPCLVESSSTSMSTNLLPPAEWQIEIFCTP